MDKVGFRWRVCRLWLPEASSGSLLSLHFIELEAEGRLI